MGAGLAQGDAGALRAGAAAVGLALALAAFACEGPPCEEVAGDVCAVVGSGEIGFNGDGLAPTATDLYLVSAARRGPDERLYVMDFNNQRLRRIGDDGQVETVIGSGEHAIASVGAPALATPLENPIDFAWRSDGRLVFVSYHDPRVLELTPEGVLRTVAGAADGVVGTVGDEGDGGPASGALFIQLDGIAVAGDDTIYVSDSLANRVRRIAPGEDGVITTVAGTGEAGFAGDGGPGTAAALRWPTALALGGEGELFIADSLNHVVRRLASDGVITTVAGVGGAAGFGGDGGPATAARLDQPVGVAFDAADGSLYVGDRGNFRVRRVDAAGTIATIGGDGVDGRHGDGGPALKASFGYVARVAIDGESLLVADQSNARVRRIVLR